MILGENYYTNLGKKIETDPECCRCGMYIKSQDIRTCIQGKECKYCYGNFCDLCGELCEYISEETEYLCIKCDNFVHQQLNYDVWNYITSFITTPTFKPKIVSLHRQPNWSEHMRRRHEAIIRSHVDRLS